MVTIGKIGCSQDFCSGGIALPFPSFAPLPFLPFLPLPPFSAASGSLNSARASGGAVNLEHEVLHLTTSGVANDIREIRSLPLCPALHMLRAVLCGAATISGGGLNP